MYWFIIIPDLIHVADSHWWVEDVFQLTCRRLKGCYSEALHVFINVVRQKANSSKDAHYNNYNPHWPPFSPMNELLNQSVETNLIMNTFQYTGIHEGWCHHRMSPTVPLYYIIFSLMCCHKKFIPPTVSCQYVFDLYCVWPNPLGGQMVHASIYYITLHTND